MKKFILFTAILISTLRLQAQDFQAFIDRLEQLPVNERQAVADSFNSANAVFPYLEGDTACHFIWFGNAQSAAIAGDATGWTPGIALTRVEGTTFWYATEYYEPDARLDYKIVTNGSNWILDPKNPNTCTGGFGPNSELRMPAYVVPPETGYYGQIPHGTVKDTTFVSSALHNERPVQVYLPYGYAASQDTFPVIVFHDGGEYLTLGNTKNILDYLIAHQAMRPVIAIFIPPVNRDEEYTGNQESLFAAFIVEQVIPALEQKYRISRDPSKRAMLGASAGGNISLYICMNYPYQFGKAASQSGYIEPLIMNTIRSGPKLALEFYLDIGKYDIASLIPLNREFKEILESRGYPFQYYEVPEGHSWGNWKGHLRNALIQFFPYSLGLNEPAHPAELLQNRPNPFSLSTVIGFRAPPGSRAEITLTDITGKRLGILWSGRVTLPETSLIFANRDYPPGSYIYSLSVNGSTISRKMTITEE